jgi:hypothetical protein
MDNETRDYFLAKRKLAIKQLKTEWKFYFILNSLLLALLDEINEICISPKWNKSNINCCA